MARRPRTSDDWCAPSAQAREEPLAATASRVERWLLVEHRGAWGPASVPSARMGVDVARALGQTAAAARARLLLLRRPAGVVCDDGRWVFAVDSRPGYERVLARHVDSDEELLALDPPYGDGPPPDGWSVVGDPLLLVCTHGRHDRCCATRGRPVAQALSAARPAQTWECSHVGGDRFAANLVVLPEGLYVGRVDADDVVALVDDLDAGRLPAGLVRGRSSLPLPTQAAQDFARTALDRWDRDDLAPVAQEHAGPDRWRVRLGGAPEVEVVVRYDRTGDGERHVLTCGAEEAKVAAVFRQVGLEVLSAV